MAGKKPVNAVKGKQGFQKTGKSERGKEAPTAGQGVAVPGGMVFNEPDRHSFDTMYDRYRSRVEESRDVNDTIEVDEVGTSRWYRNGQLHREDGPAVVESDGTGIRWFRNGELHREDGPAFIDPKDGERWYRNGQLHREDGPAVVSDTIGERWYQNGQLHREDGPARQGGITGDTGWFQNGEPHREDGPAIIHRDGTTEWFRDGVRHRDLSDGPAYEGADGAQVWFQEGRLVRGSVRQIGVSYLKPAG